MMKRPPTRVGQERHCQAKRNGTAPLMRHAMTPRARILGVQRLRHRGTEILLCIDGILSQPDPIPMATAITGLPISWETDGNGRAHRSPLFPGSNHFPFTPDIPRIFSMGSTT